MIKIPCNFTEEEIDAAGKYWKPLEYRERERMKRAFAPLLFYETWGRRNYRECFCQRCGGFVAEKASRDPMEMMYPRFEDAFSLRHGDVTDCPQCGERVEVICLGRMRTFRSLNKQKNVVLLAAAEDGTLLIRAGIASREYSHEDLDPMPDFWETRRYALRPGKRQAWRTRDEWARGQHGWYLRGRIWEAMKTCGEPFAPNGFGWGMCQFGEGYVFGAEALEVSALRYSAAEEYIQKTAGVWIGAQEEEWPGMPVRGLVTYLAEYSRRPQLEMLVKLGFANVVYRHLRENLRRRVDWRARDPAGFFRLSKAEFRGFQKGGVSFEDLDKFRVRGETARQMDLQAYLAARAWLRNRGDAFFRLCEERAVRADKALAYLQEQAPLGAYGDTTFGHWKDYLEAATALGRNMTFKINLFPADLLTEHDAVTELLTRVTEKDAMEAYGRGRFRRLKRRYAWSDGELQIVVPVNAEDIRREGKALQHCVAGYADRHIQGKTTILFLRKCEAPEERYVTIEINDATGVIIQAHGFKNERDGAEAPMARHREFFEGWLAWLRAGSPRAKNGKPIDVNRQEDKSA